MQPLSALNAYTTPPGLPTKTRPPTIVACAFDCRSPGNPNAHFNFSFGTSAAVRPALFASVNRVFGVLAPPQPFHVAPADALNAFARSAGAHIALGNGTL